MGKSNRNENTILFRFLKFLESHGKRITLELRTVLDKDTSERLTSLYIYIYTNRVLDRPSPLIEHKEHLFFYIFLQRMCLWIGKMLIILLKLQI